MKFSKVLTLFAIAFTFILTLSSCKKSDTTYKLWDLEKENCFEFISVDDAKKLIDEEKEIIIFVGSSNESAAKSSVSQIQEEAELIDYEGKIYLVDIKDVLAKGLTKTNEAAKSLGIHEFLENKLTVVCYSKLNGSYEALFDTSDPNGYCSIFVNSDSDIKPEYILMNLVAQYAFEELYKA